MLLFRTRFRKIQLYLYGSILIVLLLAALQFTAIGNFILLIRDVYLIFTALFMLLLSAKLLLDRPTSKTLVQESKPWQVMAKLKFKLLLTLLTISFVCGIVLDYISYL